MVDEIHEHASKLEKLTDYVHHLKRAKYLEEHGMQATDEVTDEMLKETTDTELFPQASSMLMKTCRKTMTRRRALVKKPLKKVAHQKSERSRLLNSRHMNLTTIMTRQSHTGRIAELDVRTR